MVVIRITLYVITSLLVATGYGSKLVSPPPPLVSSYDHEFVIIVGMKIYAK